MRCPCYQLKTDGTISLHLQSIPDNPEAAELALTNILRRKGRVLDVMGQSLQTLRENLDPESEQLFNSLNNAQTQLATLSYQSLPNDPSQRKKIQTLKAELTEQIAEIQAQLSLKSVDLITEANPVAIAQVQEAIPKDAVLVEFVLYQPSADISESRYAVYILNSQGEIQWQDLGKAKVIDNQIAVLRNLISERRGGLSSSSETKGLGTTKVVDESLESRKEAARKLDKLIMQPVRKMMGSSTHLLISPDSQLNTLPFAALVDERDSYLVENYLITYLASGRDLLKIPHSQERELSPPLLFANPIRESKTGKIQTSSLPGTKVEVEAISQTLPRSSVLTEGEASESFLKQQQSPEILHFATFGFYFPAEPSEDLNPNFSLGLKSDRKLVQNPLLRSVMIMSDKDTDDGYLTALEVSGLNLSGTKLVVTSACETALGEVDEGDGISGFRNAFTLAGAESQLSSLWKISDHGTTELMIAYYQKIQEGEGRGEALRQVQLEMLNNPEWEDLFYWAAFIPSGSWLPLD